VEICPAIMFSLMALNVKDDSRLELAEVIHWSGPTAHARWTGGDEGCCPL